MDIGTISIRYARALLKLALELGEEKLVYKEMETIIDVYTICLLYTSDAADEL